jgi:methyl-accepting chemotaxis protein
MSVLLERVEAAVQAVVRGDFEARVVPIGEGDGIEARIAHGLNRILDVVDATLKEADGATRAAAAGEYERRPIRRGIPGDASLMLAAIDDAVGVLAQQAADLATQRRRQHEASTAFHEQVGRLLAQVGHSASRLVGAMNDLQVDLGRSASVMDELAEEVRHVDEHLGSVATATTQLHATASEIGERAAGAETLVTRSCDDGRTALDRMHELEGSFSEVKRSITFIDGIARETRMLALNATIEAVHAGAAGRGFGVVAGEVKELAREATAAMGEVSGFLDRMDSATQKSAVGMGAVVSALGEIGQVTASVAAAVHEQHTAVGDLDKRTLAVREASARMATRTHDLHEAMLQARAAMEELARVAVGLASEARVLDDASQRFARDLAINAGD